MDAATHPLLARAADLAGDWLDALPERPLGPPPDVAALRAGLGGPVPDEPTEPGAVLEDLVAAVDPGLMATPGPRYFGFVTGGALPITVAAEWLVAAWDQNAAMHVMAPGVAVMEEIVVSWVADLLGIPAGVSGALVTGGQAANTVGLAAARHRTLADAGWDVEHRGLTGAPRVTVLAGEERHASIGTALRLLGLGTDCVEALPTDGNGAIGADAVGTIGDRAGPTIVVAQAGNVNTGACDPLRSLGEAARAAGAWLHVDGAFGLWAGAAPNRRHLVDGLELAHSWAVDGHKWLNTPYDCSMALCADPDAHRAAMRLTAPYAIVSEHRDPVDWNPEMSRRARAVPVYAALRRLGRTGVADLVERCCRLARRFADGLAATPGVEIGNEVVTNQVLVRFGDDATTAEVIRRVQDEGTCWMGGTDWRGRHAMRISVSNWSTTEADVDRSVESVRRAFAGAMSGS